MNWSLMNHYDDKGEMVMPRPRGKEVDEERFLRWVRVGVCQSCKLTRSLPERGQYRIPVRLPWLVDLVLTRLCSWIDAVMRQRGFASPPGTPGS